MASSQSARIWSEIETLWSRDSSTFEVLRSAPEPRTDRILLLLVHPGDAIETDGPECVNAYSLACQQGMSKEIRALLDAGADAAVLHRLSSHYSIGETMECLDDYRDAIDAIHENGAVLYGDELEAAADWIERNLMASRRPMIVMSGAWAHHECGCITFIAQQLEARGAIVTLSPHASVCPGGDEPRYTPRAGLFAADSPIPSRS